MSQLKHGRKADDQNALQEEMQSVIATRNTRMDQLVEKWSRQDAGTALDELYVKMPQRARNAALCLENQEKYLTRLGETTISNQFQTTPENVLRIVRIGTANSNRGEIFHEWPMVTTDDSIYFIEKVYAKALRGAAIGENIHETVRPNYATESNEESIGTGNGATTTFGPTAMTNFPIVPFSVKVIKDGILVANDDGNGNISGTDTDSTAITGTVDYVATGNVTVTFTTAPATGFDISIEYQWDSERDTLFDQYGELELKVTRKRFNARPQPLGYSYTRMVELTLGTSGLGNVEEMLVKAVGDEHAMRRDYKAVQLGLRVAKGNPVTTFDADFAAAGEDNDYNHAQRILSTISDISGDVYTQLKRGVMNKAVAAPGALTYLKKNRLWSSDTSQARVGGTYYAGKLDDIDVYASPAAAAQGLLANNQILLTFKNPDDDGDVSLAFGTLTELVAALDFPEFFRRGNIATVEDVLVIRPEFLRLLEIDNLP